MNMKEKRTALLPWLAIYLILSAWLWYAYHSLTLGVEWAAWLYPEDHFFENLGAGSLLLAADLCFFAFFRAARAGLRLRTGIYLILSVSFFIGAGQEFGWGQRLLDPPAAALPAAGNLQPQPGHPPADGEAGLLLHPDNLLNLLLVALSALLPVAWLSLSGLRHAAHGRFPAALLGMGPLFVLNQALAMYAKENFKPWYRYKIVRFPQAIQEIKESNLEVLCAILAVVALWELGRHLRRRGLLQKDHPK